MRILPMLFFHKPILAYMQVVKYDLAHLPYFTSIIFVFCSLLFSLQAEQQ